MSSKIVSVALYQEVAQRLRELIYGGRFKAGELIDENALSEEFGISRTPIREALKALAVEGLVVLVPRRGCFVKEMTERDLDEIFPVMAMLEGRCARDAVLKCTPEDIRRLDDLHAQLEVHAAAGDRSAYYEVNYLFHAAVQKLAGNPWLQRITDELRKFLKLQRGRQINLPGRMQASLNEHRMIMETFHQRDAEGAARIMEFHLMQQRRALAEYDARMAADSAVGDRSSG
ncbi:DNA-binding GntR family transcriptional regulator [Plasticicumulans lactativorans]|uniref:DNA-binding GntR family transcriptional regulator n=1 Tax=Plasticicumulans lactativorans TaxID=1133106 RepID=A0A4R2LEC9_9GAMM|nr:GntR family transcriptional regulator [Plasticicumulans lactativorans]TCO83016.1 DNA-binding GntR family transcriptional regulator [Plasticicumulans lactativorans]